MDQPPFPCRHRLCARLTAVKKARFAARDCAEARNDGAQPRDPHFGRLPTPTAAVIASINGHFGPAKCTRITSIAPLGAAVVSPALQRGGSDHLRRSSPVGMTEIGAREVIFDGAQPRTPHSAPSPTHTFAPSSPLTLRSPAPKRPTIRLLIAFAKNLAQK